jgi:hypothetical protein
MNKKDINSCDFPSMVVNVEIPVFLMPFQYKIVKNTYYTFIDVISFFINK